MYFYKEIMSKDSLRHILIRSKPLLKLFINYSILINLLYSHYEGQKLSKSASLVK